MWDGHDGARGRAGRGASVTPQPKLGDLAPTPAPRQSPT
eukprot:CAMPEP_0170403986 /NCGR_PEP_ID=MMETSP0117_2-20130122/26391_1 /TAXON_ID=400756 /ORGANISM="Durinskia baltica, Strain CSIRO CS-38" /LENGTH=38 /DNA_ID= /DNA_START= /DNA_END= /DNA_ORIENTATION=